MPNRTSRILLSVALSMVLASAWSGTAAAVTCGSAPLPSTNEPGATLVRDNFESGSFGKWSRVVRDGDAWAGVQRTIRYSGLCAGRLIVTSRWDSRANVQRQMPSTTKEVWVIGRFRIDREGSSGSNVPLWRFFKGSQRILDIHRQNGTGQMYMRRSNGRGGWSYTKLPRVLSKHTWYSVKVYARAAYGESVVKVWVNGTRLYASSGLYLPAGNLTVTMIGAEHVRQVMDLSFDDVVVEAR